MAINMSNNKNTPTDAEACYETEVYAETEEQVVAFPARLSIVTSLDLMSPLPLTTTIVILHSTSARGFWRKS